MSQYTSKDTMISFLNARMIHQGTRDYNVPLAPIQKGMVLRNVAIIGVNGRLGASVLQSLLDSKGFRVTVLLRQHSKASLNNDVDIVRLPDDLGSEPELANALEGHDALVVTIPATRTREQLLLANACVKAGVRRFIPADFGSVDSLDKVCRDLVPLYENKLVVRNELEQLSARNTSFSWTSLVCGHFFDWGLENGMLRFWLKEHRAELFDDGNVKWSASTLKCIGAAVASILKNEDVTKNKMLYIQSFCVSQREVLDALQKVSDTQWSVSHVRSEDFTKHKKAEADAGDAEAIEELVSVLGITRANWEGKLANDLLKLKAEDLQTVVSEVYNATIQ